MSTALTVPVGVAPEHARATALNVCRVAVDRAEAVELLDMLGLIDATVVDANRKADEDAAQHQMLVDAGFVRPVTR